MSSWLKEKLESIDSPGDFKRISSELILDIFLGYDLSRRPALILETSKKFAGLKGSKFIEVRENSEKDSFDGYIFTLTDLQLEDQFISLTEDLIKHVSNENNVDKASNKFVNQFYLWKKLFSTQGKTKMGRSLIRGLYGELKFILDGHVKHDASISDMVINWTGPAKDKRDFEFDDTWYEIKTTGEGKKTVRITSINQLDIDFSGILVVYELVKTSADRIDILSLNQMVEKIIDLIDIYEHKEIFIDKLIKYGYEIDDFYDQFKFMISNEYYIEITKTSNIMRREQMPNSVLDCSYQLDISKIN